MGKIMMNGIQYGVGGIEQAKDISYDNTESGATATDVQGALDELNAGLLQKYSFDNSYYLSGTTASANVTLNKTLSEINTFLVVFMGSGYVTRATNTVPACLLIQYPSVTHQFNIYLGGRSFVQMNRVDDTHVRIENSLDGTYCDRVYLLWA